MSLGGKMGQKGFSAVGSLFLDRLLIGCSGFHDFRKYACSELTSSVYPNLLY